MPRIACAVLAAQTCWAGRLEVTIGPLASVFVDAGDQRESFREGVSRQSFAAGGHAPTWRRGIM